MSNAGSRIRVLEPTDYGRWDDFVLQNENGTFYHLCGWKKLIEGTLRHRTYYLMSERDGDICGVLPLARVKSWLFGDALVSTPFLVYGGPVAVGEDEAMALTEAARELAQDLGVDYLELRNRNRLPGEWVEKDSYVTFRKPLEPEPEANLMAIPRKQRAMIRKGINAGLVAETDQGTSRLYAAMLECKRNLGTPFFSRRWLEAIKSEFGDSAEITTVTHEGRVVSSVMSFRFRDEVLPYYGGGGTLARVLKGNDFMYWAVMEAASLEGVKVFDYGRSAKDSGAFRFKKHWGFEPEELHYQCYLVNARELPMISPGNPRFRFLVEAWRKLPLGMANLVGPPLARRLG